MAPKIRIVEILVMAQDTVSYRVQSYRGHFPATCLIARMLNVL
jgi:hypothetical protein